MSAFNTIISGERYQLNQPEWLWLFIAIILLHVIIKLMPPRILTSSNSSKFMSLTSARLFFHPLLMLLTPKGSKKIPNSLQPFINYTLLFLLIVALSQPVRIGKKLPEPPQERDIVFIVDTSVSMILRDYILDGKRIDRMSLLKGVLDSFIVKLEGERMSIIVFGDSALTLVPLTSDQHLLRRMLTRVQATMAGRFNAIGEAIALAVKQAEEATNNLKRKRILVLLTDADQPTGNIEPTIAAELARDANVPLYTIAIGATSLAAEEKRQGGLLYSPVDIKLIENLSSITGGKHYRAGDPQALENAIQEISLHETYKKNVEPQFIQQPLYYWLLIIALVIYSLYQLVNILKNISIKHRYFFRNKSK